MKLGKYAALFLSLLLLLQCLAIPAAAEGAAAAYDRLVIRSGGGLYVDNMTLLERAGGTKLYGTDFNDRTALTADWSVTGDADVVLSPGYVVSPSRVLGGKKASVLGDSISTFSGYSNNPDYNTTLTKNSSTYPNQKADVSATETWWMQVIRECGMELLVNNSYSGDEINPNETPGKGLERCVQLHSDTGPDAGQKPDVIFIYFGTNDAGAHVRTANNLDLFRSNYPKLMDKLAAAYPDAEIFFFTVLPRANFNSDPYNDVIRQLVNSSGNEKFHLVDLYRDTGITKQNLPQYTYDDLHPNAAGMKAISAAVMKVLGDYAFNVSPSDRCALYLGKEARADHVLDRVQKSADLTFDVRYDDLATADHSVSFCAGDEAGFALRITDAGNGKAKLQYYNEQWVDAGFSGLKKDTWYTLRVVMGDATARIYVEGRKICDAPVLSSANDCPAAQMNDVPADAWYHKAVDYALTHQLMSGFDANTFGPEATLTRAQVVQILYNKEGQPALNGQTHSFSDVPTSQWYNNAVTWASAKGVVSGYGGGIFKPDDPVSLEQVFVILWNYMGNPPLTGDADAVGPHSEWAGNAIGWAQAVGLPNDLPFTRVTDPATRAQTAQMLTNLLKK